MSKAKTPAQRRAAADQKKRDEGKKPCNIKEWIPESANADACKKKAKAAIARELKRQGFNA